MAIRICLSLAFCFFMRYADARQIETSIVFMGNSKNDSYFLHSQDLHAYMLREDWPMNDYFTISERDPIALRKRVDNLDLSVRKRFGLRDRRAHLSIAKGLDRYLILTRDRSLRGSNFLLQDGLIGFRWISIIPMKTNFKGTRHTLEWPNCLLPLDLDMNFQQILFEKRITRPECRSFLLSCYLTLGARLVSSWRLKLSK